MGGRGRPAWRRAKPGYLQLASVLRAAHEAVLVDLLVAVGEAIDLGVGTQGADIAAKAGVGVEVGQALGGASRVHRRLGCRVHFVLPALLHGPGGRGGGGTNLCAPATTRELFPKTFLPFSLRLSVRLAAAAAAALSGAFDVARPFQGRLTSGFRSHGSL